MLVYRIKISADDKICRCLFFNPVFLPLYWICVKNEMS